MDIVTATNGKTSLAYVVNLSYYLLPSIIEVTGIFSDAYNGRVWTRGFYQFHTILLF